jgi:UDP-N-acetylmuramoylalanine--D-glutamate ligase
VLAGLGARVVGYDRDPARAAELPAAVERVTGPVAPAFDAFDAVIQSPGFPAPAHPKLVPEVDLAAELLRAPIAGVTGSNGKSTTTTLLGQMLAESGQRVAVGGNLGTALCDFVGRDVERVVAELSSFQLEHARHLRADVAVLLNLAPDHFDRHGTLEAYGAAKARLAELQQPGDALVANLDDAWARRVAARSPARVVFFSERERPKRGACLDGADLLVAHEGGEWLRVPHAELSWACRTPLQNALAAAAAAAECGARPEAVRRVLARFEGLPHRARLVCERGGVRWIDDSKATNPAAAARSLAALEAPVVWIAGGRNKGLDFAELLPSVSRVRVALLVGEAAPELAAALGGALETRSVGTLERAVAEAARIARPGDIVLLAPACTSLDQFRSFEERGERFAALARALPDGGAVSC